jgi:hypothetical protein
MMGMGPLEGLIGGKFDGKGKQTDRPRSSSADIAEGCSAGPRTRGARHAAKSFIYEIFIVETFARVGHPG